jgi:hypothetical protein
MRIFENTRITSPTLTILISMSLRLISLLLLALGFGGLAHAQTLENARRLQAAGFYNASAEVYLSLEAIEPSRDSLTGLLQSYLASGNSAAVLRLTQANAERLGTDRLKLYTSLARLQQGLPLGNLLSELSTSSLDPIEQHWHTFARGLKASSEGDLEQAAQLWSSLPADDTAWIWAQASLPSSNQKSSQIAAALKRMARQDWPVARLYLSSLIAQGRVEEVRSFLAGKNNRLPSGDTLLLRALSFPANTPERTEGLMQALAASGEDAVLTRAIVGYALAERALNVGDIQAQLGSRMQDPMLGLIVAQAWLNQAGKERAYEILSAMAVDRLEPQLQAIVYAKQAELAYAFEPVRYREAADALRRQRNLPTTSPEEAIILQEAIGDALFARGDYADAAVAYERNTPQFGYKATLSWLRAGKIEEVRRLLTTGGYPNWGQALLAYLIEVKKSGADPLQAYAEFSQTPLPPLQRWPIDYMTITAQATSNPTAALAALESLRAQPELANIEPMALLHYRLLTSSGLSDRADALLDQELERPGSSLAFVRLAIERALRLRQPERALPLLPRLTDLGANERIGIMLMVAESLDNATVALDQVQSAIDTLPRTQRVPRLLQLAQRWASIGRLDKAAAITDALLESAIEGPQRTQAEFLSATIAELKNDPQAETLLLGLASRQSASTALRANARLAAYLVQHARPTEGLKIFYAQLSALPISGWPEGSSPTDRAQVLRSLKVIVPLLPPADAATLNDWITQESLLSSPELG